MIADWQPKAHNKTFLASECYFTYILIYLILATYQPFFAIDINIYFRSITELYLHGSDYLQY